MEKKEGKKTKPHLISAWPRHSKSFSKALLPQFPHCCRGGSSFGSPPKCRQLWGGARQAGDKWEGSSHKPNFWANPISMLLRRLRDRASRVRPSATAARLAVWECIAIWELIAIWKRTAIWQCIAIWGCTVIWECIGIWEFVVQMGQ